MEPPGYHLHVWSKPAGLVSHAATIGDFDGPFPFMLDAEYPGQRAPPKAA